VRAFLRAGLVAGTTAAGALGVVVWLMGVFSKIRI
jgi:hypothetical protein